MKLAKLCIVFSLITLMLASCFPDPDMEGARIAMKQEEKDWSRALRNLDSALVRNPINPEAYWLKGFCYEQLGDWVKMTENYDKSLEVSDLYSDKISDNRNRLMVRYVNRAISYFDSAKWADAQANLNEEELAKYDDNRHIKAMAVIDTAIIVDPHNIEVYARAAIFAYDGGMYEAALKYSKSAIEMEKDNESDISMNEIQMFSHKELNNNAETIKWAQKILSEIDPAQEGMMTSYLRAYDTLVEAAEKDGKSDLALKVTMAINEQFPENIPIMKNLALFFMRKQDFDGAKNVYETVLTKNPNDFEANFNLGTMFFNAQKWTVALPYLENALKTKPDEIKTVRALMTAYYNSGQDDKGLNMMNKLEELNQNE